MTKKCWLWERQLLLTLTASKTIGPGFPSRYNALQCRAMAVCPAIVAIAVQIFVSFKLIPSFNTTLSPESSRTTSGELIFAGYYAWDMQAMNADSHTDMPSHSQYSLEISSSATAQVRPAYKLIPMGEEGVICLCKPFPFGHKPEQMILAFIGQLIDAKIPCTKSSRSLMTSFTVQSSP